MTLRNCAKLYQHPALLQELFQNFNYSLHALPPPPPRSVPSLLRPLPVLSRPCTIPHPCSTV